MSSSTFNSSDDDDNTIHRPVYCIGKEINKDLLTSQSSNVICYAIDNKHSFTPTSSINDSGTTLKCQQNNQQQSCTHQYEKPDFVWHNTISDDKTAATQPHSTPVKIPIKLQQHINSKKCCNIQDTIEHKLLEQQNDYYDTANDTKSSTVDAGSVNGIHIATDDNTEQFTITAEFEVDDIVDVSNIHLQVRDNELHITIHTQNEYSREVPLPMDNIKIDDIQAIYNNSNMLEIVIPKITLNKTAPVDYMSDTATNKTLNDILVPDTSHMVELVDNNKGPVNSSGGNKINSQQQYKQYSTESSILAGFDETLQHIQITQNNTENNIVILIYLQFTEDIKSSNIDARINNNEFIIVVNRPIKPNRFIVYTRSVRLYTDGIDYDHITTDYKNNVLRVIIPKTECKKLTDVSRMISVTDAITPAA